MKRSLLQTLDTLNKVLVLGLVGLTPMFFLPWSLDVLEINKQTLLLIVVSLVVISYVGRILYDKHTMVMRGWQNILPAVLLFGVFLSALFSIGGSVSWVGGSSQEYMSFFSIAALTVLFYVVTHLFNNEIMERAFFAVLVFSGAIVLLLALLNILGLSILPWEFLQGNTFNTIGTINALGVFAVVVSVLGQALWLVSGRGEREVLLSGWLGSLQKALILFTTFVTLFLLLAIDFWALWVLVLIGAGILFMFGILRAQEFPQTSRFILPMLMVVLAVFFLFLPRPINLSLPVEVTPTVSSSLDITQETFREHSYLFGSGPGTYAFDYAQFRAEDINQTAFWDVRFDRAHSYFLTLLTTSGIVGALAFVLMLLALLAGGLKTLLKDKDHTTWKMHFVLMSTWLVLVVSGFLYSWNFTLQFLFYVLSAILAAQFLRAQHVRLKQSPRLGLVFSFIFVVFSIGVLTIFFVTIQKHSAESAFAKAVRLDRSNVSIDAVVNKLDKAATLNKHNDIYYRNLSQSLLYKLNDVVETQGDAQTIQLLTTASINSAKHATDLSPYNVLNWRMRGMVYRELMPFVSGADQFAKLSYERVKQLEPNNPIGYVGLARTNLSTASIASQLTGAEDEAVRTQARQRVNAELASAEEELQAAIALKPDYAPSHYYLALVLENQGRLNEAFAKLDAVRQYNPYDVGVVFQLGQLAMRMEHYDRARLEFEHAVTLSPEFANARWFLASIYELEGNLDEAIEQIEVIAELQPDNPVVLARLQRLEEGKLKASLPEPLEDEVEIEVE